MDVKFTKNGFLYSLNGRDAAESVKGNVVSVNDEVGQRWVNKGVAECCEKAKPKAPQVPENKMDAMEDKETKEEAPKATVKRGRKKADK